MRRALARWIGPALVVAIGITITPFVLSVGTGSSGLTQGLFGGSVVLAGFFSAAFLGVGWWVTFGALFVAFRIAHQRRAAPPLFRHPKP